MRALRPIAIAVVGFAFVVAGLGLALVPGDALGGSAFVTIVVVLVAFVALVGALWKVRGRLDATSATPVSWAGSFATPAPERTATEYPLSSDELAGVIEDAGATARSAGTVADGIEVVRPPLREALGTALVRGGRSGGEVRRALAAGEWTDDPVAASVVDGDVDPPGRSIRERMRAWLFPERVVRRQTSRATQAVAEAAEEALPTVPGQTAPRSVPVVRPRLEELRRSADGHLQRAVDPTAVARGTRPPDREIGGPAERRVPESAAGDGDDPTADRKGNGSVEADSTETDSSLRGGDRATTGRQRRWRGAVAATIVLAIVGLVDRSGALLLAAAIPLAYVAYGSLSRVRLPEGVTAVRRVEPTPAAPGRAVAVTLSVINESDRPLSDVRIADGVPDEIAVLEGSPRAGAALQPGERLEVRYLVVARRGEYDFESPQLRIRGLGAGALATTTLPTTGDGTLVCRLDAAAPPIAEYGDGRVGQLATDVPGRGVSFHSTREHHADDPADRIDWRHYAKRGTLATVNYERHVAATVVLVLDAREATRVVAGRGRPTAVELGAYAATHALTDLLGSGHDVGVAVVGLDGPGPAGLHWLPPAGGREQRSRAVDRFRRALEPPAGPGRIRTPDAQRQRRKLLELAPPGAQLALFSPLLDEPPVEAVETWSGAGLPTVVVAPDVVPGNTVSGQHAQVRRRTRLARCQSAGARTVDWRRGTPLPLVIERAFDADARLSTARLTGRPTGGGA